jgi:hypothetical protein
VAVARATAAPAPRNPGAFHRGFQGGRLAHR